MQSIEVAGHTRSPADTTAAVDLRELRRRREKIHADYAALPHDACEEEDRLYSGLCDVEDVIAAAPVRSVGDLSVKLRLLFHRDRNGASVEEFSKSGDFNERLLASIERDIGVLEGVGGPQP